MYNGNWKSALRVNLSNVQGWRTNRKIVVIESDDWGSVRMSSLDAFKRLKSAGIPVDKDHYNTYDSLESNTDLEMLFNLLAKHKDKTGRHVVMTGVNVVANPDFKRIKENGFTEYEYEPYTETLKRYDNHDRVYELWKKGIAERFFIPVFHGREHLNAQIWLRALQSDHKSTKVAFEECVTGIPRRGINNEVVPNFQAAFDIESQKDLIYQEGVIRSGLALFEDLYGYKAKFFVPTNGWFNNSLEHILKEMGVEYIDTAKRQKEPLGEGQYQINKRFIGNKNQYGQIYLTRNCFFEPSANGYEAPMDRDWVDTCMHEIEIAFRWHKPATISSHRVNYIGWLHPENRERGLKQLNELLTRMLKRWPDIEFMTSEELGDLIASTGK